MVTGLVIDARRNSVSFDIAFFARHRPAVRLEVHDLPLGDQRHGAGEIVAVDVALIIDGCGSTV